MGYRPPQHRRGLKLKEKSQCLGRKDIDHPNIEGLLHKVFREKMDMKKLNLAIEFKKI